METLIIYRKIWLRGESSMLLDGAGKMCCLGFDCIRRGFSPNDIYSYGSPEELIESVENDTLLKNLDGLVRIDEEDGEVQNIHDTWITNRLIQTNDKSVLLELQRERRIAEYFAKLDVQVVFTDDDPPPELIFQNVQIDDRNPE